MAIQMTHVGQEYLLATAFQGVSPKVDVRLKFYTNNYTPTYDSEIGDFTIVSGSIIDTEVYDMPDDFSAPTSEDGVTTITTDERSITVSGACSLYGYVVLDEDDYVYWAEKFTNAPLSYTSSGGTLDFTLKLSLTSPLDCP